jgi:C4-dicarboxylate transporter
MYVFKRFKIIELIDKLNVDFNGEKEDDKKEKHHHHPLKKKISDKIKINEIVAKAFSYYILLVFFRLAIVVIGIKEIEDFL